MRSSASLALSLVLAASFSRALVNITVDDADAGSSLHFTSQSCVRVEPDQASWEVSPGQFVHSCHNGTLRRCDEAGTTVTLKFTGVAVYLVYPPWPHEMAITATLDSNTPILLTIPARSEEVFVGLETGASAAPVWGLSGLLNGEHTLTIGSQDSSGALFVDAFIYTALCQSEPCDRRRRKGAGESEGNEADTAETDSDAAQASSASKPPSGSSSVSGSSSIPFSSSSTPAPTPMPSTPSASTPTSSASTSTVPPNIAISQSTLPHRDAVAIGLGLVLGLLVVAIIFFFAWRRYRRRRPVPDFLEDKASPPYTASDTSEPRGAPSMRERSDRFSLTHTPAGSPLTGTPASCLTSLSSNSMHLPQLPHIPAGFEKSSQSPSSVNGTLIQDESEARFDDVPPPEYETPR